VLVEKKTVRLHNPEELDLQHYRRESLKTDKARNIEILTSSSSHDAS
jgi:hypothetical protein